MASKLDIGAYADSTNSVWTPTILPNFTTVDNHSRYIKLGKLVVLLLNVNLTTPGYTTPFEFGGLPFPPDATFDYCSGYLAQWSGLNLPSGCTQLGLVSFGVGTFCVEACGSGKAAGTVLDTTALIAGHCSLVGVFIYHTT